MDFRIVPEEARAFEWGIALSPDGKYLASGGDSGMVAVWDISRLRPLWLGSTRRVKMRALEYSADGSKLYGFDEDGRFWTWEALSGAIISTSPDRGDSVYTASFAPDRSWAVADSHGYEGMLWDTAKGENLLTWDNQTGIIRALAISPDGSRFLSADTENRFKYWKKGDKSEYLSRKGPVDGEPYCLAWARDGQSFWSGYEDGLVWLWDAKTLRTKTQVMNLKETVICLAVSPAGNLVAAGSHSGLIMVGNALEADKAPTIPQASGPGIRSMVFGPDSSLLAVGSYDGIIRLFNGRTGSLLASPLHRSGRRLARPIAEGLFFGQRLGNLLLPPNLLRGRP